MQGRAGAKGRGECNLDRITAFARVVVVVIVGVRSDNTLDSITQLASLYAKASVLQASQRSLGNIFD